jgi:hypothetical protein
VTFYYSIGITRLLLAICLRGSFGKLCCALVREYPGAVLIDKLAVLDEQRVGGKAEDLFFAGVGAFGLVAVDGRDGVVLQGAVQRADHLSFSAGSQRRVPVTSLPTIVSFTSRESLPVMFWKQSSCAEEASTASDMALRFSDGPHATSSNRLPQKYTDFIMDNVRLTLQRSVQSRRCCAS